ncbi:tetratricopeptide repeat protein [Corallococcus sp. bb12-1]|uniref:tetratricopeptide repeat protein n=1 Tax=Corallococcus sp. bb12-1 TaxID=2996784 RepID=UPI00227071CC|nr:tetratricopeptide repeat protein [Corallococcus sp. bb12-1]MCY1044760.1 tetratricopeptide repeat protein [Corallococcus sp. bb12-1]
MAVSKQATTAARLMKQGLLKDAALEFERALKQDPKDAAAMLGLARLRLAQHDEPAARAMLQRLVEQHPTHPEALSHLARLDAEKGDARQLAVLEALAAQPKAGFFEVVNHGRGLLAHHQYTAAIPALEKALAVQPGNPQTLTYLGMALQGDKQLDRALKRYQEAAEASRTEHLPLLLAARVQVLQGHVGAALTTLQQAILRSPREPSLIREFASLCFFAGAPEPAIKAAIDLRMQQPDNADAIYLHGLASFVAGKNEDADRILREALAKVPDNAAVRIALAKVRRRLGDDAEAQKLLEAAIAADPSEVGAANDLAVLHLSRPGGATAARAVLTQALKTHPDDVGVHLNLALALADTDKAQARTHATKAQASTDKHIREQADRLIAALGAK